MGDTIIEALKFLLTQEKHRAQSPRDHQTAEALLARIAAAESDRDAILAHREDRPPTDN